MPQAIVALASAAEYCSQTSLASVTSASDRLVGYIRVWSLLRSITVNCSSPLEPAGSWNVQNWSKVSCTYLTKRCKLGTWLGFIEIALSKQFLASVRFSRTSKMRPRYKQNKKKKCFPRGSKVLTRTKHRLVIALLGTKFRNNLLAFHKNDCIETYQVLDINNWRSQELVRH